ARAHLRERLAREHRAVLELVLDAGGPDGLDDWLLDSATRVARVQTVLDEMRSAAPPDFATLSVALREVERLCRQKQLVSDTIFESPGDRKPGPQSKMVSDTNFFYTNFFPCRSFHGTIFSPRLRKMPP